MELRLKKLEAGRYAVQGVATRSRFVDTSLIIEKGEPPKFGMPQMWSVYCKAPRFGEWGQFLFEANSRHAALSTLQIIYDEEPVA